MRFVWLPHSSGPPERFRLGGKSYCLAVMAKAGINVPDFLCVTTEAYRRYINQTGLRAKVILELERKSFEKMRWEELWDAALRIRNMFLNTPIPPKLAQSLAFAIDEVFSGRPVAVRSSAPSEDSEKRSFAGLHESFLNLLGTDAIIDHIRLVWASLFSDRALLYRQELEINPSKSTMAVVIQDMVEADSSGIVFGQSPLNPEQSIIEAVQGLNEGLVDGRIEPHRWVLHRETGRVFSYSPPRSKRMTSDDTRTIASTPFERSRDHSVLKPNNVKAVYELAMRCENLFHAPQDVEWSFKETVLFTLQSRPITSHVHNEGDERPWYLTLRRTKDNLKELRERIENELLPGMIADAVRLSERMTDGLTDPELADEITERLAVMQHWEQQYRDYCIPYAHGIRLFGEVYNDRVRPDDPFEFMYLLGATNMLSLHRNKLLQKIASRVRDDPGLLARLEKVEHTQQDDGVATELQELMGTLRELAVDDRVFSENPAILGQFLLHLAQTNPRDGNASTPSPFEIREKYFGSFSQLEQDYAGEMLELARSSYQLRDDDNIYLGRIQRQVMAAVNLGRKRLSQKHRILSNAAPPEEVVRSLQHHDYIPQSGPLGTAVSKPGMFDVHARQIVGQPASPGLASGRARVVLESKQLFEFRKGEILICDAIDPNMTFVVPLAAGIVERRGGMLIHGAIIAREYGIPCVTGIPEATTLIGTGDTVTVDGFLGIIIIN